MKRGAPGQQQAVPDPKRPNPTVKDADNPMSQTEPRLPVGDSGHSQAITPDEEMLADFVGQLELEPALKLDSGLVFDGPAEGGERVRKTLHEGEWWFSVVDVISVLVGGDRPRKYWSDLKQKLIAEGFNQVSEKIGHLKLIAADGRIRMTDCATAETLLRVIQSVPSPKVEPLKQWLARVGKERMDELDNPELSMERMQEIYEKKGYPKEWIDKRIRGIAVRQDLTDEWKDREVTSNREFAILTNEIMQGAFGLKVEDYKRVKGLSRQNLRDHMTDIELILTMLAEATTTKLHRDRDSRGMAPLMRDAKNGGQVAGRTRKDIEAQSGSPVISSDNALSHAARPIKKLGAGPK